MGLLLSSLARHASRMSSTFHSLLLSIALIALTACGGGGGGGGGGGTPSGTTTIDPAKDATLSGLTLSPGTLNEPFDPNTLNYTANVNVDMSVDLDQFFTITRTNVDASFTVNGTLVKKNSPNPVSGGYTLPSADLFDGLVAGLEVIVTSADGSVTKTYTVAITYTKIPSGSPSDASLSSLTLSTGELDQIFQSDQLSYTASVGNLAGSIDITAIATNTNASLSDGGSNTASGNLTFSTPLSEGDNNQSIIVTAEDSTTTRTYDVIVTRSSSILVQQAYLKASTIGSNDQFGRSVAISGNTLVVGAPFEDSALDAGESDNTAPDSGAVYVLVRTGDSWTQQPFLKADDAFRFDNFGFSIAIDGDTLVVGAPGSSISTGAAYVFTRSSGVWNQQAKLVAHNADEVDLFGYSVAIDGDTVVVGAINEDSSANGTSVSDTGATDDDSVLNAGAAYVFVRSESDWNQQAYLKADNAGSEDGFGKSVDIDGDTIVIGAPFEDSTASTDTGDDLVTAGNSGAAYVFTRSDTSWSQTIKLKASNVDFDDAFGLSVAISGSTIVVGANREDSERVSGGITFPGGKSGAAYVFFRNLITSTWVETQMLKALDSNVDHLFGTSVAISNNAIVVGAIGHELLTPNRGAAYIFTQDAGNFSQYRFMRSLAGAGVAGTDTTLIGDQFGNSVAVDGDTVVIGANGEDSNSNVDEADDTAPDSGAVYVWR